MTKNKIVEQVTAEFSISRKELLSRAKEERIAFPRQVAMALAYEADPLASSNTVGRMFNRDHGTVIFAIKAVKNRCDTEPLVREKVNRCRVAFNLPAL